MFLQRIKTRLLLRIAQGLFTLNALIWAVIGIASILRAASSQSQGYTPWVVALLMFPNAIAMLVCGLGIGTQKKIFFFLALAVLAVNILLTFTDQVGLLDWITLAIDLAILILIVILMRRSDLTGER
ncbi:MAG: hypothetical protein JXB15_08960 [Anaerolineales bacterium]|nr:hypothetical protein [Anaerolineales bacterium]